MNTYWTQRDGERINIKDMSDSHIENTLSMIKDRVEGVRPMYDILPNTDGEIGLVGTHAKYFIWIDVFEKELRARKIKERK